MDLRNEMLEWERITKSLPGKTRQSLENIVDNMIKKIEKQFRTVSYTHLTLPTIYSV